MDDIKVIMAFRKTLDGLSIEDSLLVLNYLNFYIQQKAEIEDDLKNESLLDEIDDEIF